jgi:predicted 3-demethylubiquinone-9 3-methyltransferase (glyoxalase superfamily)
MPTITTFLTYDNQAEEAVRLYLSVFEDGKITRITRGGDGAVFSLSFQLLGQDYIAMNAGPTFKFSEGISLFVSCDTQEEVDSYWARLTAGGKEGQCGWLVDKFGVSWQIVPKALGEYIGGKDQAKASRAVQAMMKMKKLDIAALKRAYDGE